MNRKTALKRTAAGLMAVLTVAGNLLAPAQPGTLSETALTAEAASLMGKKNESFSWDSKTQTLTIKKGVSNINGAVGQDVDDMLNFNVNFGGLGIFTPREDVDPSMVKHVVIEAGASMPKTCQQLMSNFTNLESFVVKKDVDAANVYNLESMFEGLEKLTTVDLSGLKNTGNIDYIDNMFTGCTSLKEIDLSMISGQNVGKRNWKGHTAIEHVRRAVAGCDQLEKLNLTGEFLSLALNQINTADKTKLTIDDLLDEILRDNNSKMKEDIKVSLKKAYEEYEALKKDPYNWKASDWKWSAKNADGSFDCTVSLYRIDPATNKKVTMKAAAEVTYVDNPQPTCHSEGKRTFSASWTDPDNSANVLHAGSHQSYELPMYQHDYDVVGFEWSEDRQSAKAILCCLNNECGDTKKVDADKIVSTAVEPTCTEGGYTLYVAYYQDVESDPERVEGEPAQGHAYGEPVMVWAEDLSSAEAVITCERDSDHTETYPAVITRTVAAGEEGAPAQIEYAATAQIGDETFTDYKYAAIEKETRHSIELNGLLLLNYYYDLTEEEINSFDIKVVFKKDGEVRATVPFAEAKQNSGLYGFSCPVDADEMTTEISAELYFDGVLINTHDYKLTDYKGDDETKNLLFAMKSYGAASQLYFGTDVENLANAGLTGEYAPSEGVRDISEMLADESIVPVNNEAVNAKMAEAGIADIAYRGASISLRQGIVIRYYFTAEDVEAALEKYQGLIGFTNADAELQVTEDGTMLFIETAPIATTVVNKSGRNGLIVDGTTVQEEYTANMYIKNNINKAGLKDVLTWLYYFCAEAEAY